MILKSLSTFVDIAKSKNKRRISVAVAEDFEVLEAIKLALKEGIIEPILIGNQSSIEKIARQVDLDLTGITIIHESDNQIAVTKAIHLILEGKAEILMKGMISTGMLLKSVLDKDKGLRKENILLSHIAFFQSPYYHKLLCVTDAAMNVAPGIEEKVWIIQNAINAYHKLGIEEPKIAVIGAVETVNPGMEATVHAAMLTLMNKRKQIKGCIVDGPLAMDNAISKEAAGHKGIKSDVAGDADIILVPEITSGNILYKSLCFLGGATAAAIVLGAKAPIVLTSRADSEKTKMMSIALAAAIG